MRVIIAGSRTCRLLRTVEDAVEAARLYGICITEVISGGASGADRAGETYARSQNLPLHRYPADWVTGMGAGYKRNRRNRRMLDHPADALIAVWDGKSRGTAHMIKIAEKKGIPVYVHRF